MKNKKIQFSKLQKCARIFEITYDEGKDPDSDSEIVINLGLPRPNNEAPNNSFHENINNNRFWQQTNSSYKRQPIYHRQQQNQNYPSNNRLPRNSHQHQQLTLNNPCDYCRRFGHTAQDCRKRLRQCFVCGSSNHFARDCTERRHRQRTSSLPAANSLQTTVRFPSKNQERTSDLNSQPPL